MNTEEYLNNSSEKREGIYMTLDAYKMLTTYVNDIERRLETINQILVSIKPKSTFGTKHIHFPNWDSERYDDEFNKAPRHPLSEPPSYQEVLKKIADISNMNA